MWRLLAGGVVGLLDSGADAAAVRDLMAVGADPLADLRQLVSIGAAAGGPAGARAAAAALAGGAGVGLKGFDHLVDVLLDRSISYWVPLKLKVTVSSASPPSMSSVSVVMVRDATVFLLESGYRSRRVPSDHGHRSRLVAGAAGLRVPVTSSVALDVSR